MVSIISIETTKSTNMIDNIYTLEQAREKLGSKSAVADAVGKPNQHWKRWEGKKLVIESGEQFELVNDTEFWRRLHENS